MRGSSIPLDDPNRLRRCHGARSIHRYRVLERNVDVVFGIESDTGSTPEQKAYRSARRFRGLLGRT